MQGAIGRRQGDLHGVVWKKLLLRTENISLCGKTTRFEAGSSSRCVENAFLCSNAALLDSTKADGEAWQGLRPNEESR